MHVMEGKLNWQIWVYMLMGSHPLHVNTQRVLCKNIMGVSGMGVRNVGYFMRPGSHWEQHHRTGGDKEKMTSFHWTPSNCKITVAIVPQIVLLGH